MNIEKALANFAGIAITIIILGVLAGMLIAISGCGEFEYNPKGKYDPNAPDLSKDEYVISENEYGDIVITERWAEDKGHFEDGNTNTEGL